MTKIGSYEFLTTQSFIVPPGSDIWLEVELMGWLATIRVKFEPDAPEQEVRVEPEDDHGLITFAKWDGNLGMATAEPVPIALHSNGRKVYMMATLFLIGASAKEATGKFDVQFLMEAAK